MTSEVVIVPRNFVQPSVICKTGFWKGLSGVPGGAGEGGEGIDGHVSQLWPAEPDDI